MVEPPNDNSITGALIAAILGQKRDRSPDLDFLIPRKRHSEMPPSPPMSPAPKFHETLHAFLVDIATQHDLDLTSFESVLQREDYTPDLIPFVEDEILISLLDLSSGKVIKFKRLSKEWYRRYEKKVGLLKSIFDYDN